MFEEQVLLVLAASMAPVTAATRADDCAQSDAGLLLKRKIVCASLTGADTVWCGAHWANTSAKGDWPNQAIYMHDLLGALQEGGPCLNR